MGLKDKLQNQGSNLSKYDGATVPQMDGAKPGSKLHDEYSINGNPNVPGKPTPSNLDLNGVTPPQYLNNLPG